MSENLNKESLHESETCKEKDDSFTSAPALLTELLSKIKPEDQEQTDREMIEQHRQWLIENGCCGAYDSESGCCPFPETESKGSN
jgi:hypothetical protein